MVGKKSTTIKIVSVIAAATVALVGCGDDSAADTTGVAATSATTETSAAASSSTNSVSTSSAAPAEQPGVTTAIAGGVTQRVEGADFAATITLGSPVARKVSQDPYSRYLTVPFEMTVESGALTAPSQAWALRTLSGQIIRGIPEAASTIGTSIGKEPIKGSAAGVLPFGGSFNSQLLSDDDVVIVAVELRAWEPGIVAEPTDVIGTWTLPEPVKVGDLVAGE